MTPYRKQKGINGGRPRRATVTVTSDLPLFAPLARAADPSSSHDGARDVVVRAGSQQGRLLAAFVAARTGLTAEEAGHAAGLSHTGYWKRVSELETLGYLTPTGATREASTGSRQRVLVATARARGGA